MRSGSAGRLRARAISAVSSRGTGSRRRRAAIRVKLPILPNPGGVSCSACSPSFLPPRTVASKPPRDAAVPEVEHLSATVQRLVVLARCAPPPTRSRACGGRSGPSSALTGRSALGAARRRTRKEYRTRTVLRPGSRLCYLFMDLKCSIRGLPDLMQARSPRPRARTR